MLGKHFEESVRNKFGFGFSPDQRNAVSRFSEFFFGRQETSLFVLKGYAGTGKTTLVSAIVNTLIAFKYKVVLLAPTGRAAKVFASYSGQPAFTIHKKIYRQKNGPEGEDHFDLAFNGGSDTLFFVDEASMIANSGEDSVFGSGHLLDDLMEYVYNGKNNRLVLVGDVAQLPPVKLDISPALATENLSLLYNATVYEVVLTDIMRQAEESGILHNATEVRQLIGTAQGRPALRIDGFPDVFRITGAELLEEIEDCYGKFGMDETMIICRTNKRTNRFNEGIRRTILYREEDFGGGDKIMIVRNNYFWAEKYEHIDFIANGDIATVAGIEQRKELYGHHFARTRLQLASYEEEVTAWVMLDTLTTDAPALSYEEAVNFYHAVEADYADIKSRKKRFEKVRENEFFNALQIKFAYAVTCHKAQGGQWNAVFIDQGWVPDDMLADEYWRWLYTAITRARKRLYFVNFRPDFFE